MVVARQFVVGRHELESRIETTNHAATLSPALRIPYMNRPSKLRRFWSAPVLWSAVALWHLPRDIRKFGNDLCAPFARGSQMDLANSNGLSAAAAPRRAHSPAGQLLPRNLEEKLFKNYLTALILFGRKCSGLTR